MNFQSIHKGTFRMICLIEKVSIDALEFGSTTVNYSYSTDDLIIANVANQCFTFIVSVRGAMRASTPSSSELTRKF